MQCKKLSESGFETEHFIDSAFNEQKFFYLSK